MHAGRGANRAGSAAGLHGIRIVGFLCVQGHLRGRQLDAGGLQADYGKATASASGAGQAAPSSSIDVGAGALASGWTHHAGGVGKSLSNGFSPSSAGREVGGWGSSRALFANKGLRACSASRDSRLHCQHPQLSKCRCGSAPRPKHCLTQMACHAPCPAHPPANQHNVVALDISAHQHLLEPSMPAPARTDPSQRNRSRPGPSRHPACRAPYPAACAGRRQLCGGGEGGRQRRALDSGCRVQGFEVQGVSVSGFRVLGFQGVRVLLRWQPGVA